MNLDEDLWVTALVWVVELDQFQIDNLRFSKYLFYAKESIAYLAMLLALIRQANQFNDSIKELRPLYAKLVMLSLFR